MSNFDDFLGTVEIREIRDIRENPLKPILPPYNPIVPNPQLDRGSRMSRMSRITGADPYDTEERLAIQQEGREISSLPDKPILSLAEQAALVLDGYNGDREQAAADLRVVARNFALADYIEHGITPAESPASSLAESTTPMIPDRDFDGVPGFDGLPTLTAEQHGAILHRLINPARGSPAPALSATDATASPAMQHSADMAPQSALRNSGPMVPILEKDRHGETIVRGFRLATQQPVRPPAPATITCGSCGEFEPGLEHNSLGRCSRTADGSPPVASRGYGACFPTAPRFCSDYKELK